MPPSVELIAAPHSLPSVGYMAWMGVIFACALHANERSARGRMRRIVEYTARSRWIAVSGLAFPIEELDDWRALVPVIADKL